MTIKTAPPKASLPPSAYTARFEHWAKRQLRAEMAMRGMRYTGLAEALKGMGVTETATQLNRKINRGKFSAAFFLQCLVAMGVTDLKLPGKASQGS